MSQDNKINNEFLITKEYLRFEEFCHACHRERYIGLCYGKPGVGKTLSANHYAKWSLIKEQTTSDAKQPSVSSDFSSCNTIVYTPSVSNTPRKIREDLERERIHLHSVVGNSLRKEGELISDACPNNPCELIIVDEADRLKVPSLEELRDLYDREGIALILIGMPGIEKRLARYPQLYSRVGFAHTYRPLSTEEMHFVLQHHWSKLGLTLDREDFTDTEAVSAIVRFTDGNFRLVHRLFRQIERILDVNSLKTVTKEVVEAARECLVVGTI